jgi:DNA-binding helix-turn-helix protein
MKINLLKYREQKNLTLAALSEMTGLGTGRLSEIETGVTSDPRISTIIKIADALDVTLDELVGRSEGWNLTQGICIAGAWMIKNHNEKTMVVDMLASMHITKEMMQQEHVAEEDYKILSEAIDSNWGRNGKQLQQK